MAAFVPRIRRRRFLLWSGGALLVLTAAGAIYERIGEAGDRARLPQVGRSIDIGGRSLNIYCSGEGTPAVILDSGSGEPGYAWSHIQPQLAAITRACWFDRAGYGWSDPGPFPRTSAAMADDLHRLLERAAVPPPYILVGHSLGGLNARVYTGRYPQQIAGAVLVDAAHEDEPRRAPAGMRGHTAPRWAWRPIWMVAQSARVLGLIRLVHRRAELPADPRQRTRQQIVAALATQPKTVATLADASAPDSYAEAEHAGGFGDRPLIVLTRGRVAPIAGGSDQDREFAAYEQIWMHEIQPKLVRLSSRGRQVILRNSGHGIPDDAPDAIVDAVREVVTEVRTGVRQGEPARAAGVERR